MELEKAIKILNQCTDDWNDICNCCFKDSGEYGCIGCRERALKTALNHITKQEKMIELMIDDLETEYNHYEPCLIDEFVDCEKYENCEECIKQYFKKKAEE
jgi:inorganic pyrophosphatase